MTAETGNWRRELLMIVGVREVPLGEDGARSVGRGEARGAGQRGRGGEGA